MSFAIDQSKCSGCHMCRMNCPVNAVSIKNAKYWIDPQKCVSCGTCVTVCHNGCITDPEANAPKAEPHEKQQLACDVCVIGGGAAGMVAAARASDMGASVIVLEKNHEIGGSAWFAMGFLCHYSKLHQEAGKEDPRAVMYEKFMRRTENRVNGKLVQRILAANSEWIDWLLDEHALRDHYELAAQMKGPMSLHRKTLCSWNAERIDQSIGPGGNGWFITLWMKQILEENGAKILCSTAADHLLQDASGKVVGVVAHDEGGPVEISCKSVVVAAGAFTHNREIMQKMQPLFYDDTKEPVHIFTCPTCTGDGITMCEEIGADIDYVNRRVNLFGPVRHPYPAVTLNAGEGPAFLSTGERYIPDEGMKEVSKLAYDEKRYVWKITDDANFENNMNAKINEPPDEHEIQLAHFLKDWRTIVAEEENVLIDDSLENLAARLGYDVGRFMEDIAAYNRSLSEPRPPMPPKTEENENFWPDMGAMNARPQPLPLEKGPYYAVKLKLFHENAMGGMCIDENMSVLRDGSPIPGVYAAGDNVNGIMLPGDIGVDFIESMITALTFAFNSGYVAGCEAANYVGM